MKFGQTPTELVKAYERDIKKEIDINGPNIATKIWQEIVDDIKPYLIGK